ncbi:MAG: penicillin-binding transpeptidase domain-containing protein [Gemmatimonadales bacterium]
MHLFLPARPQIGLPAHRPEGLPGSRARREERDRPWGPSGLDVSALRGLLRSALRPRGWSRAVTLMLAVGQGENDQSLANMVRFYAAMAGDGVIPTPRIFADRPPEMGPSLDLPPEQLAGLRRAMSEVVTRGTAAASGGRDLQVAGKTGTAQGSPTVRTTAGSSRSTPRRTTPDRGRGRHMEFALHGPASRRSWSR